MKEFINQLISLSLSGSLLILLLIPLKKLYKNRLSKCWQYYILLAAALRFLVPFAPDAALAASVLQIPQLRTSWPMAAPGSGQVQPAGRPFGQQLEPNRLQPLQQPEPNGLQPLQQPEPNGLQPSVQQPEPTALQHANSAPESVDLPPVGQSSGSSLLLIPDFGNMSDVLFLFWLVPAIILLVKKIKSYRGFIHCIRTDGAIVDEACIRDLLASCEKACHVKKHAELYCVPHLPSAVLAGFFHPCIAIPDKSLTKQELSLIFTHELYHYRRRDLFYKWLVQAVVCIHWFNPFVYFLEREANHACELSCDEAVIQSLPPEWKKAYGDLLLSCSKAALNQKNAVASLTLARDAKQLKERLGAIMRFQQPTKKTKLAAAALTAGICIVSAVVGAYAAPARPIQAQNQKNLQAENQAAGQSGTNKTAPVQAEPGSSASAKVDVSGYQKLLALRTGSYQNQTIRQFRNQVTDKLDTPQGNALLEQALKDEALHLHRLDNEDAFFLRNTLMLATGSWKKVSLEAVGVERPLKNGQFAELDFKASIKLNNPDIKVSEYEAVYRGLANTANAYLMSKTDAELANATNKSTSKHSDEALAALEKYAKSINRKGNLTLKVYMCCFGPEGTAIQPLQDQKSPEAAPDDTYELPKDIKKVLSLKTDGYQHYTLNQFLDYIGQQYEADHSVWKARQRLWTALDEEAAQHLSKEDYQFLTTTLPCTEGESTYPGDRVANIPPDFSGRYTLPYPKHGTQISFEWVVQYEVKDPTITVGERDNLILHVENGMETFIKNTWQTTDIGTMGYLKKIRQHLDQLVKENSVPGLKMKVLQCLSDGKSA